MFIGGMAEADAQCRVYEKVSGINYSGNPDGGKHIATISNGRVYEKVCGINYSGNPDGGKHVITTSGCDATQTAAGVAAYLLIIRE